MKPSVRLVQLFRQCLADLEMISWGTTTSWNPSRSKTAEHPGGFKPPGAVEAPQFKLKEEFFSTESWIGRLNIYVKAKKIRDDAYRTNPKPLSEETAEERIKAILGRGEGWNPKEVAIAFRTSVREIRKIRFENGRDPETGILNEDLKLEGLYKAGVPIREIARLLDKPYSTVHRQISALRK